VFKLEWGGLQLTIFAVLDTRWRAETNPTQSVCKLSEGVLVLVHKRFTYGYLRRIMLRKADAVVTRSRNQAIAFLQLQKLDDFIGDDDA
jgi:hypothetical protein